MVFKSTNSLEAINWINLDPIGSVIGTWFSLPYIW